MEKQKKVLLNRLYRIFDQNIPKEGYDKESSDHFKKSNIMLDPYGTTKDGLNIYRWIGTGYSNRENKWMCHTENKNGFGVSKDFESYSLEDLIKIYEYVIKKYPDPEIEFSTFIDSPTLESKTKTIIKKFKDFY